MLRLFCIYGKHQICRYLAEQAAIRTGATVVCTGGFHVDGAAQEQIREVMEAVQELSEWIDGMCK